MQLWSFGVSLGIFDDFWSYVISGPDRLAHSTERIRNMGSPAPQAPRVLSICFLGSVSLPSRICQWAVRNRT